MRKTYPAALDQLYSMLRFVREQSGLAGFSSSSISKIEMALEEVLVNIINHGYPEGPGNIEIDCMPIKKQGIKIVIKDQGIDFNLLEMDDHYDPKDPTKNRIGGYGIFFIKQLVDGINYIREDNSNILTLVKYHN